jgi:hypothetical protein
MKDLRLLWQRRVLTGSDDTAWLRVGRPLLTMHMQDGEAESHNNDSTQRATATWLWADWRWVAWSYQEVLFLCVRLVGGASHIARSSEKEDL